MFIELVSRLVATSMFSCVSSRTVSILDLVYVPFQVAPLRQHLGYGSQDTGVCHRDISDLYIPVP